MSYKVYQIQDSEGKSVGNHQYYETLKAAKGAAHNCCYRLDSDSKIVELEVNEVPISIIHIFINREEKMSYSNNPYWDNTIIGFSHIKNTDQKEEFRPLGSIIFN